MASSKTEHYKLNQWVETDQIEMADFNADNAAIDTALKTVETGAAQALAAYKTTNDAAVAQKAEQSEVTALATQVAAGVKLVTGSYVGNGKYGVSNKNTLTFDSPPKLLIVVGYYSFFAISPATLAPCFFTNGVNYTYCVYTSWSGNSVSWYKTNADEQCNVSGNTYYYLAVC